MYCPKCFGHNLQACSTGVINLVINGKQMDAGRFLYYTNKQSQKEIEEQFVRKLEEFFKWYSSFENQEPIKNVQIISSDFMCDNGCSISF